MNNSYESLKEIVARDGFVSVLNGLISCLHAFREKHNYRRDFTILSISLVEALINSFTNFESRYGYIAGKE